MTIRTAVTGTTEITSQGSPFEVRMLAESLAMLGSCIEMPRMQDVHLDDREAHERYPDRGTGAILPCPEVRTEIDVKTVRVLRMTWSVGSRVAGSIMTACGEELPRVVRTRKTSRGVRVLQSPSMPHVEVTFHRRDDRAAGLRRFWRTTSHLH